MKEHESVVLTEDIPDHGLEKGDICTVVMTHPLAEGGGDGYEVEFVTLDGRTISVVTLSALQVRPVGAGEIAHARPVGG